MSTMLRALLDKVDSMQEQMGNVSRHMESLRNTEIKSIQKNTTDQKHCSNNEECL